MYLNLCKYQKNKLYYKTFQTPDRFKDKVGKERTRP